MTNHAGVPGIIIRRVWYILDSHEERIRIPCGRWNLHKYLNGDLATRNLIPHRSWMQSAMVNNPRNSNKPIIPPPVRTKVPQTIPRAKGYRC